MHEKNHINKTSDLAGFLLTFLALEKVIKI